jgi:DNA-directed RNA polymerase specialized sigma24 family protein
MEMADTPKSRREALLGDAEVLASIRRVLRGRGVGAHEVDDQCRQVVAEAWAARNFPDHGREDARRYLNGIARRVAIDHAHDNARHAADPLPFEEGAALAVSDPPAYEERDAVLRLVQKGQKLFPRTFPWFLRSAMLHEEASAIACGEGVSPGYVRHEVSEIRRTLRVMAAGLGLVAAAVLVFFGWRALGRGRHDGTNVAAPHIAPDVAPSIREAEARRSDARRLCADGAWESCAMELGKAERLDPGGETQELKELRERAEENAKTRVNAPPVPQNGGAP